MWRTFLSGGSKPIYRLRNKDQHMLTTRKSEHDGLARLGWECEVQKHPIYGE